MSLPDSELSLEAKWSESLWARLLVNAGRKNSSLHIHLDMCREDEFKEVPEETATPAEILGELEKYKGVDVAAHVSTAFRIPWEKARPDSMIALLGKIQAGSTDRGARLAGGLLEVQDGPVETLEWRVRKKDGKEFLTCKVESTHAASLDASYFADAYLPAQASWRAILLEE